MAQSESPLRPPMPFMGTYEPKIDDKGRFFLPAKFRTRFVDGLVISPGQERCLYVVPMADFMTAYAQLGEAPVTNKDVRDYQRMSMSASVDEVPDKQGRVSITPRLREYAGLGTERECVVVGAGPRLEIWGSASWSTYIGAQEHIFAGISQEVLVPRPQ